jgi:hypothetical protein
MGEWPESCPQISGSGQLWGGGKFAILGLGLTATYDFYKGHLSIVILGRVNLGEGQICHSWAGGQQKMGHLPGCILKANLFHSRIDILRYSKAFLLFKQAQTVWSLWTPLVAIGRSPTPIFFLNFGQPFADIHVKFDLTFSIAPKCDFFISLFLSFLLTFFVLVQS